MVDGQWNDTKYCRNCGSELISGGEFCQKCGTKVAEPSIPPQGSGYATKHCVNCGAQMDARAEICPKCGVRVAPTPSFQNQPAQPYPPYQAAQPLKSPGLAAVLSLIIPGLGQIYNGEIGKGLAMVIVSIIMWVLVWLLIPFLVIIVLWVYGIYDAYKKAERINADASRQGYPAQRGQY